MQREQRMRKKRREGNRVKKKERGRKHFGIIVKFVMYALYI
jgi:hypothetical protein